MGVLTDSARRRARLINARPQTPGWYGLIGAGMGLVFAGSLFWSAVSGDAAGSGLPAGYRATSQPAPTAQAPAPGVSPTTTAPSSSPPVAGSGAVTVPSRLDPARTIAVPVEAANAAYAAAAALETQSWAGVVFAPGTSRPAAAAVAHPKAQAVALRAADIVSGSRYGLDVVVDIDGPGNGKAGDRVIPVQVEQLPDGAWGFVGQSS